MASASVVRACSVSLVRALADHLEANRDADPLEALVALTLHVQGDNDQLDAGERGLMRVLTKRMLDGYVSANAAE